MKKTRVLGTLAAVLLLVAGCATMHANGMRATVNRDIDVVEDGADGCKFTGTVAPVQVDNGNNAVINFHVKPANAFKFTSNGIVFVDKPGIGTKPPQGEITLKSSSDTTWTFHDRNQAAGTFAYEANVVRQNGGTPCKLDPTILNDGSCVEGCVP